jgi:pimeloyl-[acyl-carrier protein] methyl ester esterase
MGAAALPQDQFTAIQLADGARIAVGETGAGRAIVCVHGWAGSAAFFAPQVHGLSDRFRLVRPDLRGHGQSSRQGPFTIDRLADDLVELVQALALRDAVVLGWSMGAMVVWRAFARAPGAMAAAIAGVVVVDMSAKITNAPDWPLGLPQGAGDVDLPTQMAADWPAYADAFTPNVFAPGAPAAIQEEARALFRCNDAGAMAGFWAAMAMADCRVDVASVPAPMMVCYGAKSRLYAPEAAAWIAAAAPYGQCVRFEASGHAPHLEEPARFNAMLAEFAGSVGRSTEPKITAAGASRAAG